MIRNSIISSSNAHSFENARQLQGQSTVTVKEGSETLILNTGSGKLMIHVPGHSFENNDEVYFEFANGSFFIGKCPPTFRGEKYQISTDTYSDQNTTYKLPFSELISTIAKAIEENSNNKELIIKYLQQLSSAIEFVPPTQQTEQLLELINTINTKEDFFQPENIERLLDLLNQFKKVFSESILKAQSHLITFPDSKIDLGIYQFKDIQSTLQLLGIKENPELEKFLQIHLENDGLISIRVFPADDENTGAILFKKSALLQEIKSLLVTENSISANYLPFSLIEKFIQEKGCIDRSLLTLLPNTPIMTNGSVINNKTNLRNQDEAALLHWIMTIDECRTCAEQLEKRIPSNCIETVNNILQNFQEQPGSIKFSINEIGINPESSDKNALSTFTNKLKTLGFTLENELLHGTYSRPTLKTELLNLIAMSKKSEDKSTLSIHHDDSKKLYINDIVDSKSDQLENLLTNLKKFRTNTAALYEELKPAVLQNIILSERNIGNIISNIKESPLKLEYIDGASTLGQEAVSSKIIQKHAYTLFQEISKCSNQLSLFLDSINDTPELNFLKSIIKELQSTLNDISAITENKQFLREEKATNVAFLNEKLHELSETHNKFKSILQEIAPETNSFSRSAETMLQRLESLQLLSRQITTQDGTSQILTLPVKFGHEWTGVTIQILKKKNSNNLSSVQQKHYTIYLDAAPSQLGNIHATLNYEKGRNLSILMQFEHKEITSWFCGNCEYFRKILQNHNIHFVNIDFKTITPTTESINTVEQKSNNNNNNIDIKV